jgi:uncharacterized protein with HEPN domain
LTNRDPLIFYQHMPDQSREAMALVQPKTRADLDSDRLLNLALVRLLEIIGEAANLISEEEQARHAEIPWPQIVSLRLGSGVSGIPPEETVGYRRERGRPG